MRRSGNVWVDVREGLHVSGLRLEGNINTELSDGVSSVNSLGRKEDKPTYCIKNVVMRLHSEYIRPRVDARSAGPKVLRQSCFALDRLGTRHSHHKRPIASHRSKVTPVIQDYFGMAKLFKTFDLR